MVLAVFLLWAGYKGWMLYEAPGRVEPGLIERAERDGAIDIVVQLSFPPERFHVLKIQDMGRIGRVNGKMIEVRSVTADNIRKLARSFYWITMIHSPEGAQKL